MTDLNDSFNARLADQHFLSSKLGETLRYICFGILILAYSIFSSDSDFAGNIIDKHSAWLLFSAVVASLGIICDYLQYMFGYLSVRQAINNKDNDYDYKTIDGKYSFPDYMPHLLRRWFFNIKQLCTVLASIIIALILASHI